MIKAGVSFDPERIEAAYLFAEKAHEGQKRASGEPYITHPVAVAHQLAALNQDEDTIVAGLLHDVLEDTDTSENQILQAFGPTVLTLVKGVTNVQSCYNQESHLVAKHLKRFFLALHHDIRVLVIKLVDRLHNMRTLNFIQNPEKRYLKAMETYNIYIPLAEYAGLFYVCNELSDLALQHIDPDAYNAIHHKLVEQYTSQSSQDIELVIKMIKELLEKNNMSGQVSGRLKTISSIWAKIKHRTETPQDVNLDLLSDIVGFRILTNNVEDCYRIYKMLSNNFIIRPGTFKDYIRFPKINNYQSLHSIFKAPLFDHIEIQIRTNKMNDIAENGVANHTKYKQQYRENLYPFMDKILQQLFPDVPLSLDPLKRQNKKTIYCFTPKGDVIFLPENSSCLDFAYKLHSDIGKQAYKAYVNGVLSDLESKLSMGDDVEIKTAQDLNIAMPINQNFYSNKTDRNLGLSGQLRAKHKKELKNRIAQMAFVYDETLVNTIIRLHGINSVAVFWEHMDLERTTELYRLLFFMKKYPDRSFNLKYQHQGEDEVLTHMLQWSMLEDLKPIFCYPNNPKILKIEKL